MNKQFKAEPERPAPKVLQPDVWAPPTTTKRPTKPGLKALLIGLCFGLAAGVVWLSITAQRRAPQTDMSNPATPREPAAVVGLGYLEPSTTVIKLGAPGNPDASRISSLLVSE